MNPEEKQLLMEAHSKLSDTLWFLNMFLQGQPFEHPFTKERAEEHALAAKSQLGKGRKFLADYQKRQAQAAELSSRDAAKFRQDNPRPVITEFVWKCDCGSRMIEHSDDAGTLVCINCGIMIADPRKENK